MNMQQHLDIECGQWSAGYKVSALLIAAFGFVGYLFTPVYGLLALAVLPLLTFIYLYLEIDFERRFSDYIAFFRRHPELADLARGHLYITLLYPAVVILAMIFVDGIVITAIKTEMATRSVRRL